MPETWGEPRLLRDLSREVRGWSIVGIACLFLTALVLVGAWWELG